MQVADSEVLSGTGTASVGPPAAWLGWDSSCVSSQVCSWDLWSHGHFCGLESCCWTSDRRCQFQALGGSAGSTDGSLMGPICHSGEADRAGAWLSAPGACKNHLRAVKSVMPGSLHSGDTTWVSEYPRWFSNFMFPNERESSQKQTFQDPI